ncbi:MAG TPA: hypothetical protein DCR14_13220, partial [Acidimicrobiaceae bacterium]|nr:hypothetical protein [Acidimicrobiaceae bacterium]
MYPAPVVVTEAAHGGGGAAGGGSAGAAGGMSRVTSAGSPGGGAAGSVVVGATEVEVVPADVVGRTGRLVVVLSSLVGVAARLCSVVGGAGAASGEHS